MPDIGSVFPLRLPLRPSHFAQRMQQQNAGASVSTLISYGYTCMLYKPIEPAKLAALQQLYNTAYAQYANNTSATCQMVGSMNPQTNPADCGTAALIVVANAMLNLDEVVTKN